MSNFRQLYIVMNIKFIKRGLLILLTLLISSSSLLRASNAIENNEESSSEIKKEKVVYITFDDGPCGDITNEVLDILKKENVPATFFVIGSLVKGQENIVLRMKNEGHAIGLHSFSHERSKLYCNDESFLNETLQCQETLYEVTGENYNIIRFPFGCNNKSYKLTKNLVNALHEKNFKLYDWNIDSGDGANASLSPQNIVKRSCKTQKSNAIVLMHCSYVHRNSVLALPCIIRHYKENDYIFKVIDENTPEVYKIMKR